MKHGDRKKAVEAIAISAWCFEQDRVPKEWEALQESSKDRYREIGSRALDALHRGGWL